MSDSSLKNDKLEINKRNDNVDLIYSDLLDKYSRLEEENQNLKEESRILKEVVIEKAKNHNQISNTEKINIKSQKILRLKPIFYIQIIIGIGIIVLSLGFHILYLSVTDCLLFEDGDPTCWHKNWLGIEIHVSFYLDLVLYSLIGLTSILIILIIRSAFNKKS
ncbi:MAG: hypothetical protein ACW980_00755 [Promethearchaeota archaeon]|jgi:hypothetical protein